MTDDPLMLSISGLRGIVGRSLTPAVARRYARALGAWFNDQAGRPASLVLGRDSRPSGSELIQAVASGLRMEGCSVIELGIASTPGVAVMTRHLHADGGVEITASHNPGQWNGIKALRHDGSAPSADQAGAIIDRFHAGVEHAGGHERGSHTVNNDLIAVHSRLILDHIDVAAVRARKLKVVLDSVHGAGGPETAPLLRALGVELVHLYAEPTGDFPHNPEPTQQNLIGLCAAVKEHHADLGLAQDPDADRLALVDDRGVYIGEEYTLALGAMHLLSRQPDGGRGCAVVANLSTSRMLDDIARQAGATVARSKVGEANVAALMQKLNAPVGGEGNGGLIWPVCTYVRNSMAGAAVILEMLAHRRSTLSDVVRQTPAYAMVKDKVAIQPGMADHLAEILPGKFPQATADLQDGVRLDWPDRWVHVRASNTEPILRLIAEAPTQADATKLIADAGRAIGI